MEKYMNKLAMFAVILFVAAPMAQAKEVTLTGSAAESFIGRHFPDAEIPGPVKGVFNYVDKNGKTLRGYADCFVPAMGGRSDGEVSTCDVIY
jgi:hypothetical protein